MTLLLDTTFLIDVLRSKHESILRLERMAADGHGLSTSVVNVAEVYAGVRETERKRTDAFLSRMHTFDVTREIARRGGLLRNSLLRKGQTRELDDMLVAATALEHDLHVVTDNRKDFEGTGVTFYR